MTIHRAGPVYSLVLSIAVIAIALSQYHYFSRTHGLKRWVANNTIMRSLNATFLSKSHFRHDANGPMKTPYDRNHNVTYSVHPTAKMNEQGNRKSVLHSMINGAYTMVQLSSPTPTLSFQTPHPQKFHVSNRHIQHLATCQLTPTQFCF